MVSLCFVLGLALASGLLIGLETVMPSGAARLVAAWLVGAAGALAQEPSSGAVEGTPGAGGPTERRVLVLVLPVATTAALYFADGPDDHVGQTVLEGLSKGLHGSSLAGFYSLARAVLARQPGHG